MGTIRKYSNKAHLVNQLDREGSLSNLASSYGLALASHICYTVHAATCVPL